MTSIGQDLRYAVRTLRKTPGFTSVAVLTLAVGIGATTAMFTLVNGLLLRPLPLPEPERLATLWTTRPASGFFHASVSYQDTRDWQQAKSFERVAAFREEPFTLSGQGDPVVLQGAQVSQEFLATLGVAPALGRGFETADARPGAPVVALLSHGAWSRRFGGDPRRIGTSVMLDGQPAMLVGVLPRDFALPGYEYLEVLTPLEPAVAGIERGERGFEAIGRMAPGVSVAQAQAELSAIAERLARDHPDTNDGIGTRVIAYQDDVFGDNFRRGSYLLLGAVALVLLIGCANLAALQLARGVAREQEMAVRVALGAGRARLVRQMLTESLLLAMVGGGLGLAVAAFGVDGLVALLPADTPRLAEVRPDAGAFLFALLLSLGAAFVCGLVPALRATRETLGEGLQSGSPRAGLGGRRLRLQRGLVVAEITLAFVSLFGAGVLGRSLLQLRGVDPGFRSDGAFALELALPRTATDAAALRFWEQSLERIAALPGVRQASAVSTLPMGGSNSWTGVSVEGTPAGSEPRVGEQLVAPGYFDTLGIPLTSGRDFMRGDAAGTPRVAIVNQTMARLLWPGQSALGRRFKPGRVDSQEPWVEIVAIAGDVRHRGRAQPVRPEMFLPLYQHAQHEMVLVVSAATSALRLAADAERAIHAVDPGQAVANVRTLDNVLAADLTAARLLAGLTAAFAATALLLAALGVHGVVSFSVAQGTREIGIRMALGAEAGGVLALVLRRFLRLALVGLVFGMAGALALGRMMAGLLFGVAPLDPATAVAVAALLLAVVVVASMLPARRAAGLDPTVALRHE